MQGGMLAIGDTEADMEDLWRLIGKVTHTDVSYSLKEETILPDQVDSFLQDQVFLRDGKPDRKCL